MQEKKSAFPVLRRMHLFIALADDELRQLADHFDEATYEPGQVVFTQGDPGDAFYVIEKGRVEITVSHSFSGLRRRSILVDGDYFGEMALVRRGRRSATVTALDALKLWKLSLNDFNAFVLCNPKIKPHLGVALQSRQYARDANFKWLTENEIVYLATLRHRLFLLQMMALPSLAMLGIAALAASVLFLRLPANLLMAPLAMFLLDLGWLWWNWEDFHNDWYVVTNKRVVDIDKIVLFYDSRAEAPLSTVQNTTIKTTEMGRQLGYGDVIINTFSGAITLHDVPHPQATADLVLEHVNRSRVQQRLLEREQLRHTIKQAVGLEPRPEKPPKEAEEQGRKRSSPRSLLSRLVKQFDVRVREEQGDAIIYRKHLFILAKAIGPHLLGTFGVMLLWLLRLFDVFTFLDPLIAAVLGIALLLIFGGVGLYRYVDWKNDIYMVTPTQVLDIERKPLGTEQRKAANLDAVMNVTFVRPSFIAMLLNYGTVTVQAGPGGEMKFYDVFDPLGVQQDIYRRKEARELAKAQAATQQRHEELGQYFTTFYEIMEEERKKRDGKV